MAFCGKCGARLHENATFCANCGTSTGVSAQSPAAGGTPVVTHPGMPPAAPLSRGFFSALFDISFTSFVTTRLIKFLFVVAIIAAGLAAVGIVVYANSPYSQINPAIGIILAPILFFIYILIARVYMEIIMVTFRMAEYLRELVEQGRNRG